jgi:hypothetical protein
VEISVASFKAELKRMSAENVDPRAPLSLPARSMKLVPER